MLVRCFQDDVERVAERLEQLQERFEQVFAGDRGDEGGQAGAAAWVDIGVMPVAGAGDDIELPARADGVCEREGAVVTAGEMGLQRGAVGAGDRPFRGGGSHRVL